MQLRRLHQAVLWQPRPHQLVPCQPRLHQLVPSASSGAALSATVSSASSPSSTSNPLGLRYDCSVPGPTILYVLAYPELYVFEIFCGYSFQNEAYYSTALLSEDDCYAACAQADTFFDGPVCKGFTWDGTCKLYGVANSADLIADPSSDAAVLVSVLATGPDSNFNNTGGSGQSSSAVQSAASSSYTLPPHTTIVGDLTLTFSTSCTGTTYTDASDYIHWSTSCEENYSWYTAITATATVVYTSDVTTVIPASTGLPSAAASSMGDIVNITSTTKSITTESGSGSTGFASSGVIPPITTVTEVISNSTLIYVTTVSGASSSGWESEGIITPSGTGSSSSPSETGVWNSTISGSSSTGSGTGGVISPPTGQPRSDMSSNSTASGSSGSAASYPSVVSFSIASTSGNGSYLMPNTSTTSIGSPSTAVQNTTSSAGSPSTTFYSVPSQSANSSSSNNATMSSAMPSNATASTTSAPFTNSTLFAAPTNATTSSFNASITGIPRNYNTSSIGNYNMSSTMPYPNATCVTSMVMGTVSVFSTVTETVYTSNATAPTCDCTASAPRFSSSAAWPTSSSPGGGPSASSSTEPSSSSSPPAGASPSASSSAHPLGSSASPPQASSPAAPSSSPTTFPRRPGVPPTPAQIAAACDSDPENAVYNGDFGRRARFAGRAEPLGWGWSGDAAFTDARASAAGGGGAWRRVGRFNASRAGQAGALLQPLTLCPGATYRLSAAARAPDGGRTAAIRCRARFEIGGRAVGTLVPGPRWEEALVDAADYTVGPDDADAAVDLRVEMACPGAPSVGGERILELDDIDIGMVS